MIAGDEMWCTNPGEIGIMINGVYLFNALTGPGDDAVHYEEFDNCQGHTSPRGSYHYHQLSCKVMKCEMLSYHIIDIKDYAFYIILS